MPMTLSRRTLAALVGSFLLAGLVVVSSFWAFTQMKDAARSRQLTYRVILEGEALKETLLNAETGQRGYLLTGNDAFLEPYAGTRDRVQAHLQQLRGQSISGASKKHLEVLAPLIEAKLDHMAQLVGVGRNQGVVAAGALVATGKGKGLMDDIRAELAQLNQGEAATLARIDRTLQVRMTRLFAVIVSVSLLTLLVAGVFVFGVQRESQHRLRDLVHLETHRLLASQEATNVQLNRANDTLQESKEKLAVTLHSIGDGVIATDAQAHVNLLNPVAERLTGWTEAEALGRPVDEVFHIINQETRQPSILPIMDALNHGTVQGLANHTLLIARDGVERSIADSCAPIRGLDGQVIGAVLIFRNVTEEYAAEQALHDSHVLVQTVLQTVVDGIITFHATSGVITTLNPAAEAMFGYTAAELSGANLNRLIPELEGGRANGTLDFLCTTEEARLVGLGREVEGQRKNGQRFPLEIAISDMNIGGQHYFTSILRDVSARKQAEAALVKAGALQSAIFNSAHFSSIATDAKGIIQIFNVGAERMLGYTASEVINLKTPADISDTQEIIERAQVLSLDIGFTIKPGFEALVFKASRGIEDIYELTYVRKDGSRFPAIVSVTALRNEVGTIIGYLLIGTDNSARKRAEEELIKAGALQAAIFESENFSSIATDDKGVIQIFNVGAEEMLGYLAAEVMNKITPADLSDPQEVLDRAETLSLELSTPIAPGFEALAFKASRGIQDIYELTLVRKDGSRFPAVVSVTALRDQAGAVIGYLLIATDNGARKQIEAERELLDQALKDKNAELETAISVAEKANLAKSEFLSSMSHELRSPLNAILGFAQLMDSAPPPATPAQKASIERILHAGWYLLELINEILDLAVIESGRLSLSEEPVSLEEVFADCQALIEPQGQKRGIHLTFPTFATPIFVHADRVRLKQVLINLLTNAVKYNRPGGSVVVSCVVTEEGRIRISVLDTGQGLSQAQLRQLFQPFNRLGQERGTEEGTGIGLVMSKLLVEMMGGHLGVESSIGVGSTFWYDLRASIAPVLSDSKVITVAVLPVLVSDQAPRRTVLCVEDNPANLALIEQLIARRPDLRLISAADATIGIRLAQEHHPEVILMDINLPGISGHEALKILRMTPSTAHIPVLAISANAMVGDIQRGQEAGFFRYLPKPIIVKDFLAALDEAMVFAAQNPFKG